MGAQLSTLPAQESQVSRAEFDQLREQLDAMTAHASRSRVELERELASVKEINAQLEAKLKQREAMQSAEAKEARFEFSQDHLEEIIERILQDETINIRYLPDAVERHLYRNVFHILLGVLSEIVRGSSMELLGHELRFQLQPKEEAGERDLSSDQESSAHSTGDEEDEEVQHRHSLSRLRHRIKK